MHDITSTQGALKSLNKERFVDSTPLLADPVALRDQGAKDGFLFFRNFLPIPGIRSLREDMLTIMVRHGFRKPGLDVWDAHLDLDAINTVPETEMRLDIGVSSAVYNEVQKLERLHGLPHHPKLIALFRTLLDSEILVHPRHIARMITGHRAMTPTPPHQDFPLIQGTANTWTCWIPLGDCPREMGGLSFLLGSHRQGYVPIQPSKGAGGIAVKLCPSEVRWAEDDYQAGDIVVFTSHMIHKGLRCQDKELIRLSLDIRYQSGKESVEMRSLFPHCELTWDEIYADWKSKDLQYYWSNLPLGLTPYDNTLMQPSKRIC